MRVADRGEERHVGAEDPLQPRHFARLRDPRLKDRQPFVALEHQHREGNAQLRVVALGRAEVFHAGGQLLGDPLLDHRLAVRSRDGDHRAAELRPEVGREPLQRLHGVRHLDVAALRGRGYGPFDEERPHAARLHRGDEVVRVVVGAVHRHEERLGAQLAGQRAAVGHDRSHGAVGARESAARDGGDLRKKVFHGICFIPAEPLRLLCRSGPAPGFRAGRAVLRRGGCGRPGCRARGPNRRFSAFGFRLNRRR